MNAPNSQVTHQMVLAAQQVVPSRGDMPAIYYSETKAIIEAALTARTEARPNELDAAIAQRDAVAGKLAWLEESVRNAGCEIDYSVQSSGESADDCVWNRRAEEAETAAPPAAGEGFVVVPVATASHAAIICDEWKLMFADTAGIGKFETYSYEPGVDETRDELRAAIAAARPQPAQGDGWLPIESAPRDGTWVLLTGGAIDYGWDGDAQPAVVAGQFTDDRNGRKTEVHWQFAWYDGGYYGEYCNPTHWRPIPPPPAPADGGKNHG